MRRLYLLVVSMSFVCFSPLLAQHPAHEHIRKMERQRFTKLDQSELTKLRSSPSSDFDVTYYRLQLEIDPIDQLLAGNVTIKAIAEKSGLRQIALDLSDGMVVSWIESNDRPLNFSHVDHQVQISLPRSYSYGEGFEVVVHYSGRPMRTGFGSFAFDSHAGAPIISTLSEPFGARDWWPCQDHPADKADSVDVIVTVPTGLTVASNGTLRSRTDNGDGTSTFFWAERYPITTYLVSLAITNYRTYSEYYHYSDVDSMEVQYYVYPESYHQATEDFSVTVPMIACYADLFGEYPFVKEKYGMAQFPWSGAMEHQTCTSYGTWLIRGDHSYDAVVAHELAHQWFGDLITMTRWSHIWLNEGFASYAEALWAEHLGGKTKYHDYMQSFDPGTFPTSVFVYDSTNAAALFSKTVYDKGALVLHMLRHVMGDQAFFTALRTYVISFAFGNATTEQFRDICESAYGADLDWFFQQWVYGRYRPAYEYSWQDTLIAGHHHLTLRIDQVQQNIGPFKMPLDIRVSTQAGDTTFVVWCESASHRFNFDLEHTVTDVTIDPDHWVLKKITQIPFDDTPSLPQVFVLHQNYPNPFNAGTTIAYELPEDGSVTLDIYNLLGERVRRLQDGFQSQGLNRAVWDGRNDDGANLSSGVYFYRIRFGQETLPARKMLLLR